jgi:hypothetical protein
MHWLGRVFHHCQRPHLYRKRSRSFTQGAFFPSQWQWQSRPTEQRKGKEDGKEMSNMKAFSNGATVLTWMKATIPLRLRGNTRQYCSPVESHLSMLICLLTLTNFCHSAPLRVLSCAATVIDGHGGYLFTSPPVLVDVRSHGSFKSRLLSALARSHIVWY